MSSGNLKCLLILRTAKNNTRHSLWAACLLQKEKDPGWESSYKLQLFPERRTKIVHCKLNNITMVRKLATGFYSDWIAKWFKRPQNRLCVYLHDGMTGDLFTLKCRQTSKKTANQATKVGDSMLDPLRFAWGVRLVSRCLVLLTSEDLLFLLHFSKKFAPNLPLRREPKESCSCDTHKRKP